MAKKTNVVVGLDVGTHKVCAVVGEQTDQGPEVVGVGIHPSRGLRKGVVINIEATMESIKTAEEEAGPDPREELARQLLEYQRFQEVALGLGRRPLLGRDVFTRRPLPTEEQAKHVHDVGLGDLLDALQEALKKAEPELVHEIVLEQISLRERVGLVLDLLRERGRISFTELFAAETSRLQILVTFLASLELVRSRMIDVHQTAPFGPIFLSLAVSPDTPLPHGLEQL